MAKSNTHIYVGLGTLSIVLVGAFLVYWKGRKRMIRLPTRPIDLSLFDSPDIPGSGRCMDRRLLFMLKQLEAKTGYPIFKHINSGARSPLHNRKVGGVSNSSHKIPTCKAVDIGVPNTYIRNLLVRSARDVGFKRIGVGRTFVHLDVDSAKSQYVAWGYPAGAPAEVNPFV